MALLKTSFYFNSWSVRLIIWGIQERRNLLDVCAFTVLGWLAYDHSPFTPHLWKRGASCHGVALKVSLLFWVRFLQPAGLHLGGLGVQKAFLLFVSWSWTDDKFSELECDRHSLPDINVYVIYRISVSEDSNILELEERWKFKEVKAFAQGHQTSKRQKWDCTSCIKKAKDRK